MLSSYEKKLVWIILGMILFGTILFGREFLSIKTLLVLGNQIPEYGILSIAFMVTLLVSGMNLSIVAMTTLAGVTGALVMTQFSGDGYLPVVFGIVIMIAVGGLTGLVNGMLVSWLEVPPILTTLGTMLFFRGMALNITKGGAITSYQTHFTQIGSGTVLGIPISLIILVLLIGAMYYLIHIREFGQQLYRIGKNKQSAIYSGINHKKVVLLAYMIAGLIAGVAAMIMTARYNSIRVDYGSTYLIKCIVIVSLGGVDLKGGNGSIRGVILALLIVSIAIRMMNLAYIDSNLIDAIMGGILIVNIIVQHYLGLATKKASTHPINRI